jgi:hypothetical protein
MDEVHAILLLKKNVRQDIIRTIIGYPPVAIPNNLKEWLEAIRSVELGYKSNKI